MSALEPQSIAQRIGASGNWRPGKLLEYVASVMNGVGTAWVFGLMFLIVADIFARNVFSAPIRGVSEIVGQSIVITVFLQLAHTLQSGRITRAEMYTGWLGRTRPVAAEIYGFFFHAAGAYVLFVIGWNVYPKFTRAYSTAEYVGVAGDFTFPSWPIFLLIVVGAAATAVQFAFMAFGNIGALARIGAGGRIGEKVGWGALAGFAAVVAVGAVLAGYSDLSRIQVGAVCAIALFVLIYGGMHIGIALLVLAYFGIALIRNPGLADRTLALAAAGTINQDLFAVVPLFVLMGLLVSTSDIGRDTYDVAAWIFRRVKGGLGVSTVAANAVFAAITGVSIASAAVFTKIAVPQMIRHGYTPRFATGIVAGSSVLGMLIPPSILLIIYGALAEVSVGKLFIAAIIPGLILATAFALMIIGLAVFWPRFVGTAVSQAEDVPEETIATAAVKLVPIVALIVIVLGGIYGGVFSPTEAGAAGAFAALVIGLIKRRLNWKKLWQVLIETGHVSVSILFLLIAANTYARMLALSGLPAQAAHQLDVLGVGIVSFFILFIILIVLMGMILDSISIMLIVLPILVPVVANLGGDLIWFGIIAVITVEIGLLTPPFGLTVFVVRSTLGEDKVTLGQVFAGTFPFAVIMLLVTILLIAVPDLTLALVR